ncbi:MAG: diacylglycerol kinase family protein [Bacteroidota bacterium]
MKPPVSKTKLIFVNVAANNNEGKKRWERIEKQVVASLLPAIEIVKYKPPFDFAPDIRRFLAANEEGYIISSGGDGSLNVLLNTLLPLMGESRQRIGIGAIGIGSSNDFHKPFNRKLEGIPLRIDSHTSAVDIGQVDYTVDAKKWHRKYFLINASIGLIANANELFNKGDFIIDRLKNRFLNTTILYTALKTIATHRNMMGALIQENGHKERVPLTNLSIIKNRHVSGEFMYDQKMEADNGLLGLNYCYDLNRIGILQALSDLKRGRFSGKPKRVSTYIKSVEIELDKIGSLETDGEITAIKKAKISVLPKAIQLMN